MDSGTVYVIGAGFSRGVGIPASKELISTKELNYLQEKLKTNSDFTKKIKNYSKVIWNLRNAYGINMKSTKEFKEETQKRIRKGKRIDSIIHTKKITKITEYSIKPELKNKNNNKETSSTNQVLDLINKLLDILINFTRLLSNNGKVSKDLPLVIVQQTVLSRIC